MLKGRKMVAKGLGFLLISACCCSAGWTEFAVYPDDRAQVKPDVDNGRVVWQQENEFEGAVDWDIFGIDLLDASVAAPIYVAFFGDNQTNPSISGDFVVWEDDAYGADDLDVHLSDLTDPANPTDTLVTNYTGNQINPVVHGNTVIWQHPYTDESDVFVDWDLYAADITDPADPQPYPLISLDGDQTVPALHRTTAVWQDAYEGQLNIEGADIWLRNKVEFHTVSAWELDQTAPAVYGSTVVWQEDFSEGDFDIYAADISDPSDPSEFSLVAEAAAQTAPDIHKHLVVWQDNRNGHWDIYGYNLTTRQEFRITSDASDQTNPAIWENLVVWEDNRSGVSAVWAAWLEGPEIAECLVDLPGDVDGDCRVNLTDLAAVAENWLVSGLEPVDPYIYEYQSR